MNKKNTNSNSVSLKKCVSKKGPPKTYSDYSKNKIKTRKSIAKVLNKRKNDYKIGSHGSRHNTGSKNGKFNRKARKGSTLSKADQSRFKNILK